MTVRFGKGGFFFLFLLLNLFFWLSYPHLKQTYRVPVQSPPPMPAWVLNIISLGQKEMVAETMVYHTIFYNEFRAEKDQASPDYSVSYQNLNVATQLDPCNMDAYYYAQALLSDQQQFLPELNSMLERGMAHKEKDFYIPLFLATNYYFTLGDKEKAGRYYAEVAKRLPKNKNALFTSFSARVMYEAGETGKAVAFLEEMLREADSPLLKQRISMRLQALQTVLFLEEALLRYKKKTGNLPDALEELVTSGILRAIPPDPYGGQFYLTKGKRVLTTSNFVQRKQ
ncbi:tetratricopeptide repeat protein [Thiovibrio sp. JS02]